MASEVKKGHRKVLKVKELDCESTKINKSVSGNKHIGRWDFLLKINKRIGLNKCVEVGFFFIF